MIRAVDISRFIATGLILIAGFPSLVQADGDTGETGSLSYTGDTFANTRGGIDKGSTYTGLALLELGYTGQMWSMHANLFAPHGDSFTERYVGDFAVVSNIDMPGPTRLQEFWWQRAIGTASIRFGMLAADSEFWGSEGGGLFINSAFGAPSIISANLPGVSIFPVATLGVRADWQLDDARTLRLAVVDGNAGDPTSDNPHGLDVTLDEGALVLSELEWQPTSSSTFKFSGYYHTGEFVTDNGSQADGSWGALVVADTKVSETLTWFGRAGYAANDRSLAPWSIETGINLGGLFDGKGTLGIAYAHIQLDNAMFRLDDPLSNVSHESIIEITFDYPINDLFAIQPDIQYIINPGGDSQQDHALVVGLRLKLSHEFFPGK